MKIFLLFVVCRELQDLLLCYYKFCYFWNVVKRFSIELGHGCIIIFLDGSLRLAGEGQDLTLHLNLSFEILHRHGSALILVTWVKIIWLKACWNGDMLEEGAYLI